MKSNFLFFQGKESLKRKVNSRKGCAAPFKVPRMTEDDDDRDDFKQGSASTSAIVTPAMRKEVPSYLVIFFFKSQFMPLQVGYRER